MHVCIVVYVYIHNIYIQICIDCVSYECICTLLLLGECIYVYIHIYIYIHVHMYVSIPYRAVAGRDRTVAAGTEPLASSIAYAALHGKTHI